MKSSIQAQPPFPVPRSPFRIAEVAFNIPLERSFHYLIPPALQGAVQPGMRVLAPFGRVERVGFIVRLVDRSPIRELKSIRRIIDPSPVIAEERWALASWMSAYYCCSLGEALAVMVPTTLRLARSPQRVMQDGVPHTGSGGGWGAKPSHDMEPPPLRMWGWPAAGPAEGSSTEQRLTLSELQRSALKTISDALDQGRSQTVLLYGVTGSGKTELYLQAIEQVLGQGRSAICLIPEIALTPQTIDRFRERFGDRVAVWHSRLTARQRAVEWHRLATGQCRIVVGARSAVFTPVQRLGLIILDEEHEQAYKQGDSPRYHAREVARERARLCNAVVVLGSATPSVESYYAATHRRTLLVHLPERVEGRPLPQVEIIDMREEMANRRRSAPFSDRLQRALEQVVQRGEQAMLLLNRRGFARVAQCQTCGIVVRCERCAVPLVYHAARQELVCHYCNFHEAPGEVCRACQKGYLTFRGTGTERVESELHRLFPVASIARMDRDTTKARQSHRDIYEAVKTRQVGLLVGTQMIAKGLDFPQVTLVGVVSADTALNLPDFRAGERTFDLLTQVAGRAGRGEQPGRVLIQTFCPSHYAIQAAGHHDYQRFYNEEITARRRLQLPPFVHLIELTLVGSSRERVFALADRLIQQVRRAAKGKRMSLLGPAPHRVPRLRRAYRVCVILKGRTTEPMVELLRRVLQSGRRFGGLPVIVDVDPL